jgi:hypothetical protein
MFEDYFNEVLENAEFDYVLEAEVLAQMKPYGW